MAFSFAAATLTADFLEADIIAAYDRALHKNHGRATDRRAIWDNGSTVSDAREFLANTSRRFEPGQVDPEIVRKIRESLLSASAPNRSKAADPRSTTKRSNSRFPCRQLRGLPRSAQISGLPASLAALGIASGQLFELPVRVSRHLPLSSSNPAGSLAFAHLFLRQRCGRIALPLGKCRAVRFPLSSPLVPCACQARSSRFLHSKNRYGSSIEIRNRPIRPRYFS